MANQKRFTFAKDADSKDLTERMQRDLIESDYIKSLAKDEPKNALLPWLQTVEIVSVAKPTIETPAHAVFRFPVLHEFLNPAQTLHGGLSAAIFDVGTSWVLYVIRKPGFWYTFGRSRSLNITYLRPAMEGEMLLLECEIVHAGKRLCLLKGTIKREKDGAIISTCEHQKYNVDAEVAKA